LAGPIKILGRRVRRRWFCIRELVSADPVPKPDRHSCVVSTNLGTFTTLTHRRPGHIGKITR
jgi:hypothetical protein